MRQDYLANRKNRMTKPEIHLCVQHQNGRHSLGYPKLGPACRRALSLPRAPGRALTRSGVPAASSLLQAPPPTQSASSRRRVGHTPRYQTASTAWPPARHGAPVCAGSCWDPGSSNKHLSQSQERGHAGVCASY